jgi:mono/diheme cytochrome c family protein
VRRGVAGALALALILSTPRAWEADNRSLDEPPSLATQVHAIFQARCVECHGSDLPRPKGKFGYVLDLARVAANPKMIVPDKSAQSEFYQMLVHNEMPDPKGIVPP